MKDKTKINNIKRILDHRTWIKW